MRSCEGHFGALMVSVVYILDIDDCIGVTCSFHGTCVDGVNSHTRAPVKLVTLVATAEQIYL